MPTEVVSNACSRDLGDLVTAERGITDKSFVGVLRVRAVRTVGVVITVNAMSADSVVSTPHVDAHTSWVSGDDAARRSGDARLSGGVMTGIRGWTTPSSRSFVRFRASLPFPFPPPSPSPVSSVSPHTRIPRVCLLVGLLVSPVSSASPHTRVPRVFSLVGLLVWTWVGVVFAWLTEGALFMVLSLLCLGLGCASWGCPLWVMWLVMAGWA